MNKRTYGLLVLCLMVFGSIAPVRYAVAADSMDGGTMTKGSMTKGAMAKDAMAKDAMTKDTMSKDSTKDNCKEQGTASMQKKDTMEQGTMKRM